MNKSGEGKFERAAEKDDGVSLFNENNKNNEGGDDKGKGKGKGKPSYTAPPKQLPDDWERVKPKGGRPRYRLPDGDTVEWGWSTWRMGTIQSSRKTSGGLVTRWRPTN